MLRHSVFMRTNAFSRIYPLHGQFFQDHHGTVIIGLLPSNTWYCQLAWYDVIIVKSMKSCTSAYVATTLTCWCREVRSGHATVHVKVIMQYDEDFMEVRLPYMQYLCWCTLLKQERVTVLPTYHFAPSLAAVNHNWNRHYYHHYCFYYYNYYYYYYYYYYLFITTQLTLSVRAQYIHSGPLTPAVRMEY
jgi:hypothetical protein